MSVSAPSLNADDLALLLYEQNDGFVRRVLQFRQLAVAAAATSPSPSPSASPSIAAECSLRALCNMQRPHGEGDKAMLRRVALALGLGDAGRLQKRAMQFGARIANKHMQGTVRMDDGVRLSDIVNQHALGRPGKPQKHK